MYETVTCQVTYTGTTDDTLDDASRADLAVVSSFSSTAPFTGGSACTALSDIGTANANSGWSLNALSPDSVDQSSTAGSSSVNCHVSSDRTAVASAFDFKVGDTLTINVGY